MILPPTTPQAPTAQASSHVDLLPLFAAAASNVNPEYEKEALIAKHMLQRVSTSAAETVAKATTATGATAAPVGNQMDFDKICESGVIFRRQQQQIQ